MSPLPFFSCLVSYTFLTPFSLGPYSVRVVLWLHERVYSCLLAGDLMMHEPAAHLCHSVCSNWAGSRWDRSIYW